MPEIYTWIKLQQVTNIFGLYMSVTYLDWYQATHKVIMWHIKDHDGQDHEHNHIFSTHLMYMYQIWAWQIPLGNYKKLGPI